MSIDFLPRSILWDYLWLFFRVELTLVFRREVFGSSLYVVRNALTDDFELTIPPQRNQIPQSLLSATSTSSIDSLTDWGTPSASYPSSSSCDIATYFDAQSLVIDIDLCGDLWVQAVVISSAADVPPSAGAPTLYLPQCASQGPQQLCVSAPSGFLFQRHFCSIHVVQTVPGQRYRSWIAIRQRILWVQVRSRLWEWE